MSAPPRIGPYELLGEIARGGQGAVYRARHAQLGTEVALKLLLEPEPRHVQRFQDEARILSRLSHKNLPRVTDLGQAEGRPYLAMELVGGRDLKALVREDGLPTPERAVEVLETVAHALHYCHEHGLVHRDVKPGNVLIEDATGRPLLVDFGLVKRDARKLDLGAGDAPLSHTGETKGTPEFMAPEQADPAFGEVGPASDVYALGATLFFLLTGEPPYTGTTSYNVLTKLMTAPVPDPRTRRDGVPGPLAELVWLASRRTPAARPPSAAAFAQALRSGLARAQRRSPLPLILGALLALAGVLAGVVPRALEPAIRWPAATRLLGSGAALTPDELSALAGQAPGTEWEQWLPFARAASRLASEEPPDAVTADLPAGAERALLEGLALLRAEDPDLERCFAALERADGAALPWSTPSPAERWGRLTERLELAGRDALAAGAAVRTARAIHPRPGWVAWYRRACERDPGAASRAGAPLFQALVDAAGEALAVARDASDVAAAERARWLLIQARLAAPFEPLPPEDLEALWALGTEARRDVGEAALRLSFVHLHHQAVLHAVLTTPVSEAEARTLLVGHKATWPHAWAEMYDDLHLEGGTSLQKVDRSLEFLLWRPDVPLWWEYVFSAGRLLTPSLAERALEVWAGMNVPPGLVVAHRAVVAQERGDPRVAAAELKRVGELDPSLARRRRPDFVRLLISAGEALEGLAIADELVAEDPLHPTYQRLRTDCLQALGRREEAALAREQTLWVGLLHYSRDLLTRGENPDDKRALATRALAKVDELLQTDWGRTLPEAYGQRGACLRKLGRAREAAEAEAVASRLRAR